MAVRIVKSQVNNNETWDMWNLSEHVEPDLIVTLNDFLRINIMFEGMVKHHYLSNVVNPDFWQALVDK